MKLRAALRTLLVFTVIHLCVAGVTPAQTTPNLLTRPWDEGRHFAETIDDLVYIADGHVKDSNFDTQMFYWDSYGRIRFNRDANDPHWVLGYRILAMNEDSEFSAIKGDYWDIAMTLGYKFDAMDNGWQISVVGGAGTANDGHFSNSDAIYGIGSVNAGRKLDPDATFNVGLRYNGNSLLFPDFPLPYAAYERRVTDEFRFTLGLPSSAMVWWPVEMVSLKLDYNLPVTGSANVSFWFTKTLCLFTQFDATTDGFYIEDADNRRIFYSMNRVTGGVRWLSKWADLRLGVGYAFDQEFERGFDLRDTHKIAKLTDEPFISLRIHGTF